MSRRGEMHPKIVRLRAEGLTFAQIGERLGIGRSTVSEYFHDPTGAGVWARKHRGTCVDCGTPTYTASPGKQEPGERCVPCHTAHVQAASREWLVSRIQEWAAKFGDPPVAADWQRSGYARNKHPAAALRQDDASDEDWPSTGAVLATFGSWNAGIEAAGFVPLSQASGRLHYRSGRAA